MERSISVSACLITGAILAVGISLAHSYLGERFILQRLFHRTPLPHLFGSDVFTRQTLRFAWHLTSIAWIGLAGVLVSFTIPDPVRARSLALQVISLVFFIHTMLTAIATRGRHLGWIVFFAITVVVWLGIG
jgi:hypothetical protein